MNLYGLDYSAFDMGFSDPTLIESLSSSYTDRRYGEREEDVLLKLSTSILKNSKLTSCPSKHRHDGTSPLPLGMDWSPPPPNWDGPNTTWPHDFHTGWSYCVTIPSCSIFSESGGSEPVVFYRVQVGLQSPQGVTTTREVLRRFSDFLKLSSDLKRSLHKNKLPPAPRKGLLRMKSRALLEERKRSLEDWMAKVLSDIDFSRSAPVAYFLELEAAARSSFCESSHDVPNVNFSCNSGGSSDPFSISSRTDGSVLTTETSASTSNFGNDSTYEASEIGSALYVKNNYSEIGKGDPVDDLASLTEATMNEAFCEKNYVILSKEFSEVKEENFDKIHLGASSTVSHHHDSVYSYPGLKNSQMVHHAKGLLRESHPKDTSSATLSEISNLCEVHQDNGASSKSSESIEASGVLDMLASSDLQFSHDELIFLPMEERQKMNRLFTTMQHRLVTSKTDIEDLKARLDQELAVRQYLTTKVKDLETELESTKTSRKESLEQAIFIERERFTQMQWDMEELSRKYVEMEFSLKAEQDERVHAEATKTSIIKENEALRQELDSAREKLKNLQQCHEEADFKSKSDVKLLVREVKSLRNSQSQLQHELDRVAKEDII